MQESVRLWEEPTDRENYMIAGWYQWADAGEVSSGLPQYLIDLVDAKKIGEIDPAGFYLFQIPGTHHLVRPEVKLVEGCPVQMMTRENEIYYAESGGKGLVLFLGEEPHLDEYRYTEAFFSVAHRLKVKRIIIVGGVFGALPYDKDREITCVYSLPHLKEELDRFAVNYSNYEGGASIGAFMAHCAQAYDIELITLYALAPTYEFPEDTSTVQSMRVDQDWKAWYDVMRRIDYMLGLGLDLSDLRKRSEGLIDAWATKVDELARTHPELQIREYMEEISTHFTEQSFIPLDDAWNELGDLLNSMDE